MRLTSREIISLLIKNGHNLTNIERLLDLRPFGMLQSLVDQEGPTTIELDILLNLVYTLPFLLDVADTHFDLNLWESRL